MFFSVLCTEVVHSHKLMMMLMMTTIGTLRWAVLAVIWIKFCLTGPISLCVDSFMFAYFVFVLYFVFISYTLHVVLL